MYELILTYDTSRPAHRKDAYKMSISPSDAEPCEMEQVGPVFNGIVHYRGVYETRAAAWEAYHLYRTT